MAETHDPARQRYIELKRILEERRREILAQVQAKTRDGDEVAEGEEASLLDTEVDVDDDIDAAILRMKRETLRQIADALERLESGTFGDCFECGDKIAVRRLRALPFAIRCKDCEELREVAQRRERAMSQRGRGFTTL